MKMLVPIVIAVLGVGAGVGAGVALKPAPPEEEPAAEMVCAEGEEGCEVAAPDPFAPVAMPKPAPEGETANVSLDKPFVVPVFRDDKVAAMMVASMTVVTAVEGGAAGEMLQPRLRDAFLAVMFRHANSGGFDGAFTEGRKIEDLKAALLKAAQEIFGEIPVHDVLITEIVRQDM